MSEIELQISDIFHPSWDSLRTEKGGNQVIIVMRYLQCLRISMQKNDLHYGYYLRIILKSIIKKKHKPILKKLDPEQLVDIFNDMDWILAPWYFFPQPIIKAKGLIFRAPDERLADMSYNNWKFADAKFTKYLVHQHQGEDTEAHQELDKLMACIYLPSPLRGDKRGDFQENTLDQNAALLSPRMKPWEKLLALETYAHIRTYIVSREKDLFPTSSQSSGDDGDEAPFYTGEMWANLHFDLADTEAFKGYEAAGQANIYHALDYLNKKAKEREKSSK